VYWMGTGGRHPSEEVGRVDVPRVDKYSMARIFQFVVPQLQLQFQQLQFVVPQLQLQFQQLQFVVVQFVVQFVVLQLVECPVCSG
jgi:hypothetical protein